MIFLRFPHWYQHLQVLLLTARGVSAKSIATSVPWKYMLISMPVCGVSIFMGPSHPHLHIIVIIPIHTLILRLWLRLLCPWFHRYGECMYSCKLQPKKEDESQKLFFLLEDSKYENCKRSSMSQRGELHPEIWCAAVFMGTTYGTAATFLVDSGGGWCSSFSGSWVELELRTTRILVGKMAVWCKATCWMN